MNLSYAQSKAYWTGPYLWDEYWVDATGVPVLAFNPHIGAQPYANRWLPPLTGDKGLATSLTADKKLPEGTYTVNYTESVVRPFTSLELVYDDQGDPSSTQMPTHMKPPYTSDLVVYTFTVGPPVP